MLFSLAQNRRNLPYQCQQIASITRQIDLTWKHIDKGLLGCIPLCLHNLIPPQALKLIINNIFFPTKRAPQCQSRPLILFVRQSSLAGQCVSKYVSSLSLSNELHRKSCGRFVIFCWKMINARHSCGICQTLKNPTLPLKRTPWSTKIIHSHIWIPPPVSHI